MAQSTATSNLGFQDYFSTTLSSAITSSDTTIPLVAAPTPTEGFLVIEPNSSTNREIIMYTSLSGSSVVCGSVDDRGISGTTARAHGSGSIVKMIAVADMFEALQSGNGLSSSFKIPVGVVQPEDLTSGTGTSWAWSSWTPTFVNLTVGNGTHASKYIQIGKTVHFRLIFTLGSTSSVSGAITFTLPVTSLTVPDTDFVIGNGQINTGSGAYNAFARWASTTTGGLRYWDINNNQADTSSTNPGTWASGWKIIIRGTYEAA